MTTTKHKNSLYESNYVEMNLIKWIKKKKKIKKHTQTNTYANVEWN